MGAEEHSRPHGEEGFHFEVRAPLERSHVMPVSWKERGYRGEQKGEKYVEIFNQPQTICILVIPSPRPARARGQWTDGVVPYPGIVVRIPFA